MEHTKRKPIRLKDYDYSSAGAYFITICTRDKCFELSKIDCVGADNICLQLTDYGKIVEKAINEVPLHYPDVKIDKYVIMPDHIHLILIICSDDGRIISAPTENKMSAEHKVRKDGRIISAPTGNEMSAEHEVRKEGQMVSAPTVMRVIGQMKRRVSKETGVSLWQKSYYDHVIRDDEDFITRCRYIEENPVKWIE